jgi:hypothetical protein
MKMFCNEASSFDSNKDPVWKGGRDLIQNIYQEEKTAAIQMKMSKLAVLHINIQY